MDNRGAISLVAAQNIYMLATQSAMKVFELSAHLPPENIDTLRGLIIDSSSKVCTHLNQAWLNREDREVFTSNIRVARIEVKKTLEYIESAGKASYLEAKVCESIKSAYDKLIAQISEMIRNIA